MDIPSRASLSAPRQAWHWLRAAPWAALAELACRAGYVARGAVYLSIGLVGLLAAARLTPHATGALGALEAWADWPFGVVMLSLAGLGLWGFSGWRFLQSVFDADRLGSSPMALLTRTGQLVSGLVYAGLAVSLWGLIGALDGLREVDERARTEAAVGAVLDMPAGGAMVVAAGMFILAAGVGGIVQALFAGFSHRLSGQRDTRLPAALLGRLGYLARGIAFLPAGAFMVTAGWHARASEAKGLGGALDALSALPFGHAALGAIAVGLIAFGAYALFEARFRPMRLSGARRLRTPRRRARSSP
ncbi:MAG TPA: DUF1206 domain-containing protein [Phenylobacterium sp.]|nr:DUF1206 domain-containing protein [Phenylobacterium sp.]